VLRGTYSYNSFKPLGLPLGVKARVNKLNSPRINWRHKLSQGIGLLFRLDIVASKEYCLTIMV
jgi:predicted metal-dependent peptidase